MIRKEVLDALVKQYQEQLKEEKTTPRTLNPRIIPKFATIISGIRRCGKSTLAKQLVQKKAAYYFHFENVQLAEFEQQDFAKLDQSFKDILGKKGIYVLDEIQNIPGWEIYVRQLVDQKETVLITGSNATMLSKELGTRLTGRNLRYELFPFSFKEFLDCTNTQASLQAFDKYFTTGGFPEYVKTRHEEILTNLFQDIFYRDILVRNDIRSEPELKQFVAFISANIGVPISYTKIKSHLHVGSVNTIIQFVEASEQAYLFFPVKKYSPSIRKQQKNPKKIYCVDNGLLKLNAFSFSKNKGRYLENIVFMHLRRQGQEIYYHQETHECDFIIKKETDITTAIQVCHELHDENQQRELAGIIEACKTHNLTTGTIITHDQEDTLQQKGITVHVTPAWKWLLAQESLLKK